MLDNLELSLMAFPQSWTAATHTLSVNLLVLPVGNPLGPIGSVPKFAGTTLKLTARLITGQAPPFERRRGCAQRAIRGGAAAGRGGFTERSATRGCRREPRSRRARSQGRRRPRLPYGS